MPLTLPLPDWLPWWAQLVLLVVAILFGFALLMMPFAVFGLKGRLDFLEAQLDDIHAELRMIAMRLPDAERSPVRPPAVEELTARPTTLREPSPTRMRVAQQPTPAPTERRSRRTDDWSPIQPDRDDEDLLPRRPLRADIGPDRGRTEPTLRWPPR